MHAIIVFSGFFLYAFVYNLLGLMATDIMRSLGLTLSQSGQIVSFQQIGSVTMLLLSFYLYPRLKQRHILLSGYLIIICALVAIVFSGSATMLFISYAFCGVGVVIVNGASNALLTEDYFDKRSTYLPLLHFCYSLGAALVGYVLLPFKGEQWRYGYLFVALLFALIFIAGLICKPKTEQRSQKSGNEESLSPFVLLKDPAFLLFTVVMFLFMGCQLLCVTWIPVYADLELNLGKTMVASTITAFSLGTALSRLFIGPLMKRGLNPYVALGFGPAFSGVALIALTFVPYSWSLLLITAICSFCSGATIPLFMVVVPSWYPNNTNFLVTTYILSGTIGRMIFPYLASLIGELTSLAHALRLSSLLFFAASVLMALVYKKAKDR